METNNNVRYLLIGGAAILILLALLTIIKYQNSSPKFTPIPSPPPPIEEIVNDVSVSYSDGTVVVPATFHIAHEAVTFTHPAVGTLTLPRVISGSGARYANADESLVFWEHQDKLIITKDGMQIFQGPNEASGGVLTEAQARAIAEESCIKGDESLANGLYNDYTKTWWFDANLNSAPEGCNPACVVSEETSTAEINWRCTGLKQSPDTAQCGLENCHGLDIVCGPNPVEMCTMEYVVGDKCRQFAQCGMQNGSCGHIENSQFATCKSCVEKCTSNYSDNAGDVLECESKCGE